MRMRFLAIAALAAASAAAGAAPAADPIDYARHLELAPKGTGAWGSRFTPLAGEGPAVGLAVEADWWDGPGDPRAGDPKKSALEGAVFEVRRGEGPWVALPACSRDLRLVARTEAPADAKDLLGAVPGGDWSVRQKAGSSYPLRVRIDFTCRGDPLLVKDLRLASIALPDLDPAPVVGRPHLPDRTGNRTLGPGAKIKAVAVVENRGGRKTKEVDVDLVLAPFGKRQGRRIGFAQCAALAPGASAEVTLEGVVPEDLAAEAGAWEALAIVNPRGAEREFETWNNALGRAFRFEIPVEKPALPGDLRDR
jgi:hypothetical protein